MPPRITFVLLLSVSGSSLAQVAAAEITEDTIWSGERVVGETTVVRPGATLTIRPGTTVLLNDSVSLVVRGRLLALGGEGQPVRFTRSGRGRPWGSIVFERAEVSRLEHSIVEYSTSATSFAGKDYTGAVSIVNSHVDVDHCVFQNLPNGSPSAEGDGIDLSEGATARVTGSRFVSIGEGVHADRCHVVVENCLFTDIRGDNDGVDLDGESRPVSEVRNNMFIGSQDDAVHPDRSSAIVTGNLIMDCRDHGIVLRNIATPYLANNVILNCRSAGIAIENQNDPLLVNNTIASCGRGLRLFHLERSGVDPGGGRGTARNCIIWDCPQPITLADDSRITVAHCIIAGGDVWPGVGNTNADPLFVADGDYRLQPDSPAIDAGTPEGAPAVDIEGNERPCGSGVDIGAYESGNCSGPAGDRFRRGDANADGADDVSDPIFILLFLFAGGLEPPCKKSADTDDSARLDATDPIYLLYHLFLSGPPPGSPFPACGRDPSPDKLGCEAYAPCRQ